MPIFKTKSKKILFSNFPKPKISRRAPMAETFAGCLSTEKHTAHSDYCGTPKNFLQSIISLKTSDFKFENIQIVPKSYYLRTFTK